MLYKFKSRATSDLIMLEPVGRRVLEIIGKSPDAPQGIITAEQIPAAIAALQKAVQDEESGKTAPDAAEAGADPTQEAQEPSERVWLRQRVAPFIEMLQTSAAQGREVVW
ncbi:DUF1840 domain-containing protein [Comamonas sp. NLF-1-9]|uniref:DUF1840 domain-containing protein n=1 Tax=Comamonas sp. NLF-1-9 TaxID=2853163 RepID=UPI001C443401|nr:DUF1840 domain-containing protein [Comamonas sp. NLF-1-9]QXL84192.1 DUF1840 domain-containing protein [Comamonas sp. NLF-1-9]